MYMENQIQNQVLSNDQPPIIPHDNSRNNVKTLIIILSGLIVLAGVLLLGMQLGQKQVKNKSFDTVQPSLIPSQTPTSYTTENELTNWSTFFNKLLQYQLKYPPKWKLDNLTQDKQVSIYYQPDANVSVGSIFIEETTKSNYENELRAQTDWTTETFGNQQTSCRNLNPIITVCYLVSDKKYLFINITKKIDDTEYNETLDKIFSTLTFTVDSSSYFFTMPDGYQVLSTNDKVSTYGSSDLEYLTITKGITINLNKLAQKCEMNTPDYCLDEGGGWGQKEKVMNATLDGVPARSFYISGGVDNAYHVVQTTTDPIVELKMYVAGGGLDATFQKILTSFKFEKK